jgi:hypothetical protein
MRGAREAGIGRLGRQSIGLPSFVGSRSIHTARIVLFVAILSGPAALSAQSPPLGAEFQVATATSGSDQRYPRAAMDSQGNFVVIWAGAPPPGYFGQRYDASGNPQGAEFQIDTPATGDGVTPAAIGMQPDGDFIVAWSSYALDGSQWGVFARQFASDGTPKGAEFQVNTYTTNNQMQPSVAVDPSGDFVVVWQSYGQTGPGWRVFGQRFNSAGVAQGSEFQINDSASNADFPSAGMDTAGDFVVAWRDNVGYNPTTVFARRYDNAGNSEGSPFQVNATTTWFQDVPAVAVDSSGGFVVTWPDYRADGEGFGIEARLYDSSGNARGAQFQVNTYTPYGQIFPSVAYAAGDGFIVTWTDPFEDGNGRGIFAQRFASSGRRIGGEFQVNTYTFFYQERSSVAANALGNFVIAWQSNGQRDPYDGIYAKRGGFPPAGALSVDDHGTGGSSNLNGVLEPGETVVVDPSWSNSSATALPLSGTGSNFVGPPGPTYTLVDGQADYGTIAPGTVSDCYGATQNCYVVSVTGARPATHWDATFGEALDVGVSKSWTVHVGASFQDVPITHPFYRYVEDVLHNGITGGCGGTDFCPDAAVRRDQMSVFLLRAEHGATYAPPMCAGIFADVPCPSLFANWIEQLFAEGITGGCGGGNYCPAEPVTRAQAAVFLLKTEHGSAYAPPPCSGVFADVLCPSEFADWIERLAAEGVTGGCGGGNYCPDSPNTRGQMAVFLQKTFGLSLYGP